MKQVEALLLQLESSDFDRVISELLEEKQGAVCYYAIDTYDLLNYCFPFGIQKKELKEREKIDIDIIADEQYTLFQLFNNKKTKVLLLDEYVKEVVDIKRFIEQLISSGIEIINSLEKFEKTFYELGTINPNNEKELEDLIKTKLSLIISTAIGINNDGLEKLVYLFKTKKITLNGEELEASEENNVLIDSFEETFNLNPNKDILHVLKRFHEEIDGTIKDEDKIFPTYENDASVIDRINKVNELLEYKYLDHKLLNRIIVLYLSSTTNSYRAFNNDKLQKYFSKPNGKNLNPHRNISMLFLKSICTDNDSIDQSIKNVENLKDRILKLKEYKKYLTKSSVLKDINYLLHDQCNYYRENFENYSILSKYKEYRKMITKAIEKFNAQKEYSKFSTLIIPVLEKLRESGSKEIVRSSEKLAIFENWENQIKFVYYFNKAIENVKNDIFKLQFLTGKDPINGIIHHLPIIFHFSDIKFNNIIGSITRFITEFNVRVEKNDLVEITRKSFDKVVQLKPSLEERLLKAFILLLIPEIRGVEDTNELAFYWTNNILENEIKKASNKNEIISIEKDYRYFIGWVSRRCRKYDFSCSLFKESISLFPGDPRFYHGRSLSKYCIYESLGSKNNIEAKIKLLSESISDAEKAFQLYDNQSKILIIQKTQNTILNTLIYFNTELSRITNNNEQSIYYLKIAEKLIGDLRSREKDFENYPEYLHTSCYLLQQIISNEKSQLRLDPSNYNLKNEIINKYNISIADITRAVILSQERLLHRSYEKYMQYQLEVNIERERFKEEFKIF